MSKLVRCFIRNFNQSAVLYKKKKGAGKIREIAWHHFNKIKTAQSKFQKQDGLPVYLKGGTRDKVLFQITLLGLGVGFIMAGQVILKLALPH